MFDTHTQNGKGDAFYFVSSKHYTITVHINVASHKIHDSYSGVYVMETFLRVTQLLPIPVLVTVEKCEMKRVYETSQICPRC